MEACPIDKSLKIFGQKYALHVIRNMLLLKQYKFGQFLGSVEGINTKTLSIRLHELEDFGLIKRTIIKSRPVQTEYSLTDKGRALAAVLEQIAVSLMKHCAKQIFKDKKPRMLKEVFGYERRQNK
jgi:DNA-binding HxlR family transcriptional regulator